MEKAGRFRRARALFDEATALPSEQRAIFVQEHSASDESTRAEVMRLLSSVGPAGEQKLEETLTELYNRLRKAAGY